MSWARYDDALPHNRKVSWLRAQGVNGIAALGLHVLLNTWSRHEGMQGFIPAYVPEQLAGKPWSKLIGLLADDGCAMLTAVENGWMINDYEEYGDRDDGTPVEEKKARLSRVRAEAGRRGGLAKAAKAPSNTPSNAGSKTEALPDGPDNGNASNSTSFPPESSRGEARSRRASDTRTPGNTGNPASKTEALPASNGWQSSSPVPVPVPTNSPNSPGLRNAPTGFIPRVIRTYVDTAHGAGRPAPEESQARVDRSARSLIAQGYPPDDILEAARNAALAGWTDLATQLQRDAARTNPPPGGRPSTTDQRANAALTLAHQLEQKAIG